MNIRPPTESSAESFPTQVWGLTRDYADRDPAVPTSGAQALFVVTEREGMEQDAADTGEEDPPTENAAVRLVIREVERPAEVTGPPPSDAAMTEVWITPESGVGARATGRHAGHLLDITTYAVTVAGIVWGPKAVLEMASVSPPGWAIFCIMVLQIAGLGWVGRNLVRRRG